MATPEWLTRSRALTAVFVLDGLLALGFGVASLVSPRETFGSIVNLGLASEQSLMFAALKSLSGF